MGRRRAAEPKRGVASLHHEKTWGGAFRFAGELIRSFLAYLYDTIEVWGIGSDGVGLIQNTKAPPKRSSAPGGLNVIRKEAWLFCRTSSGVRLCWELEEPKGPKGPKAARREPSALEGWILEVLYCNPKGSRGFLRNLSTEGRGVRLCWALSKPEGPKGRSRPNQPRRGG